MWPLKSTGKRATRFVSHCFGSRDREMRGDWKSAVLFIVPDRDFGLIDASLRWHFQKRSLSWHVRHGAGRDETTRVSVGKRTVTEAA